MIKVLVIIVALFRKPVDQRITEYRIDNLDMRRNLDLLWKDSTHRYRHVLRRMRLVNLASRIPGSGRWVTQATRSLLADMNEVDDTSQQLKYSSRLEYSKRRRLINTFARVSSVIKQLDMMCVREDVVAIDACRRLKAIVDAKPTCGVKAFYNFDGACAFNAVITWLIHSSKLPLIIEDSRRNPVSAELSALMACKDKVVHASALRQLVRPGLEYIPSSPLGGGIPYMYFNQLVSSLPLLEQLCKSQVRINNAQHECVIHEVVAIRDCSLPQLLDLNKYRFTSLPEIMVIRIFKSPRQLTSFQEYMIDCPLSNLQMKTESGDVKTYNLRATVEHHPEHAWAHVKADDKWYRIDNGVSTAIDKAVTARSNLLVYEAS